MANKDIDAVHISLPDHQHAIVGVHAVNAGKDVYLQKPASLTIEEGRILSNAVKKSRQILQMGSQQRSIDAWPQFKKVCELVRTGRIGQYCNQLLVLMKFICTKVLSNMPIG